MEQVINFSITNIGFSPKMERKKSLNVRFGKSKILTKKANFYKNNPFGNMTKGRPVQGLIFGFNGEKYCVHTGYQFLRARFYDKSTGRFLTRDTFLGWEENPLSLNRYSYVHNDPVNYIDPTGHSAQTTNPDNLTMAQVRQVQERLISLGYQGGSAGSLRVNGSFDPQTMNALADFRIQNRLMHGRHVVRYRDETWNRLIRGAPSAPVRFNASQSLTNTSTATLTQADWRNVKRG